MTPIEPKTDWGWSRRQLFRNYLGSPGRRNNKNTRNNENTRSLCFKNPNIEPQPTNSRHITCLREGKSPSVALMCRTAKTHCLINVNKSQTRVSYFFDSHKMHLLSLFFYRPKSQIFLLFHVPKQLKSLPFHIPETWKRYPFLRSLPVQAIMGSNPWILSNFCKDLFGETNAILQTYLVTRWSSNSRKFPSVSGK